jgi:hypothetical protein
MVAAPKDYRIGSILPLNKIEPIPSFVKQKKNGGA